MNRLLTYKTFSVVAARVGAVGVFLGGGALVFLSSPLADRAQVADTQTAQVVISEPKKPLHLPTPEPLKAIYMTSWVAGTKDWREKLVDFVKQTELNSIIIDVKDYTGFISFDTEDEFIKSLDAEEIRVPDMKEFIEHLHDNGIYAIARITVFQDPVYAKKFLDQAVQRKNGTLWKDRKGLSFIDPSSEKHREYIVRIAKASERAGFDELNFDYVRFPSDGNMRDIAFPLSGNLPKAEVLEDFFRNLKNALRDIGVPLSADLFGMTMTNTDDLNIGQVLERAEPYFDYISPMVYPSHYPAGFNNYKNPAANPYEIVKYSMSEGVSRIQAASSSPLKLRPWLQDFDLGADYDAAKVRAQIQAIYDSGLTSWMIWDPSNKYTRDAYQLE